MEAVDARLHLDGVPRLRVDAEVALEGLDGLAQFFALLVGDGGIEEERAERLLV